MAHTSSTPLNLLGYSHQQLVELLAQWGEPRFRATQLIKWIHQRGVTDFEQMTDVSRKLRDRLERETEIRVPEIGLEKASSDGTVKWVLRLPDGNAIETVFIPEGGRGTLCISSQVGCALDCTFCSTAQQGFNRNLTSAEIIGQVWLAMQRLPAPDGRKRAVSNVVLMGMGEPLANFDAVVPSCQLMTDDNAYGLSRRRVTLSTSGLVPALDRLSAHTDVALAVSLHAPNDALRDRLVPINRKYPLAELLDSCRRYVEATDAHSGVTFEYVLLAGVNDQPEHANELAGLLRGIPGKINLIPFNPFPGAPFERPSEATVLAFERRLQKAGYVTTVRRTRGDDIDAACGQLVGQVEDRTNRGMRMFRLHAELPQTDRRAS
ncbi:MULTISPECIES: bifunctional tRNA (adenosine(37)-C2)-methyltransferase TrmG/ribosomal RNA large subunit methyltransferase RlmN [Thioalkalivibrio]|uniref:Dual-specificity RNA methyltransferase RlmN n=1 Tax=Thioalkalivibrio versutus TaxID=106634 RepID=A0A0G3G5I6_9GAMM|nr:MULTISPECIES: bifunctional tRNA (adenosine(37)-C2)-methyltransferase TrmG/ribosomal RNA large subunit methyltransferase RlmN [Thioalkalivibrio]AKJ94752.1 ribosomal RNA large subunit methyltransferase N [Thioalkalivibrio versutus]OOC49363.1 bifunctional tRNA (adenosine(37)-C2)-methyltransferase TrmG/ribosomal RNA large subunit methyltransferase RlmN [Thioalkalivibrio versutus]